MAVTVEIDAFCQYGRAKSRKIWLLLRRVIALAELSGLPRASMAITQPGASPALVDQRKQKAEVWESICVLDRVASMMWSFPLATANVPLPQRPLIHSEGQVNPQAYLYHLVSIMSRVFDLDTGYSSGRPLTELFNEVIVTDQELRSLASLVPNGWWKSHWSEFSTDALLQLWHQYLVIRTHLHLALKYDEDRRFAFNFIACLDACQELAKCYMALRPISPGAFFANRFFDIQAFTASVFLLLASHRTVRGPGTFPRAGDIDFTIVDQVVQTLETAADRAGGDVAHQAANAIRYLSPLLQQPQMSESQKITLSLPLIGKIHVSRKSYVAEPVSTPSHPIPSQPTPGPWQTSSSDGSNLAPQTMPFRPSELDLMNPLSFSMEVPEDYPFLMDEALGAEQWLTWTGLDSNG